MVRLLAHLKKLREPDVLFNEKDGGALRPLKFKNNDGFRLNHFIGQTLRNFSGFFHPRLVGLVARSSYARQNASLKLQKRI